MIVLYVHNLGEMKMNNEIENSIRAEKLEKILDNLTQNKEHIDEVLAYTNLVNVGLETAIFEINKIKEEMR